jgi:hypothetical protein
MPPYLLQSVDKIGKTQVLFYIYLLPLTEIAATTTVALPKVAEVYPWAGATHDFQHNDNQRKGLICDSQQKRRYTECRGVLGQAWAEFSTLVFGRK